MTDQLRALLPWWPAVAVPVLVIGVIVLVVQQVALSNQLVDLRRDMGGLATEVVLLQQEVRQLRRTLGDMTEVGAPRGKARQTKRAKAKRRKATSGRTQ